MNGILFTTILLGASAVLLLYLGRRKTFFGRSRRRFLLALGDAPRHVFYLGKSLLVFREPFHLLYSYVFRHPLKARRIRLRNGIQLVTSDSPDDAATLM